jgi:hypothetical protein
MNADDMEMLREHEMIIRGQNGLMQTTLTHQHALFGDEKELGATQKVSIMWRVHVWLLCTFSAIAGAGAVQLYHLIIGK